MKPGGGPPRGKTPRVEVHYFEKGRRRRTPVPPARAESSRRMAGELPAASVEPVPASSARTLPELQLPRVDPLPPGPGKAGRGRGRKGSGNFRRRTTEEFNVEASGPAPTVPELLGAANPLALLKALTPGQLAEMAVAGHGLFEAGALESARRVFELLVAMGPRESFPFTMLGTVYLAMELPDRALALFESALELDKGDIAASVYRGELRLRRGKVRHALGDLERAVAGGDAADPFVQRGKRLLQEARRALRARATRS